MLIKSCCLLLFIFSECLTTNITRLEVPAEIVLGSREAEVVLLDCQYELESDEGLVVTWHFNNALVYQWIKDSKPSSGGPLKDHIDLNYNVSALPNQRYRAVRLLNPLAAFSGEYECKVSTYASEDHKEQRMQFYDPGEGPVLSYSVSAGNETGDADDVVSLECEAGGVFPQPEITITVNGQVVNQTQTNSKTPEGLYNTTVEAGVSVAELSDGADLRCDLTLPYTTYNSSDVMTYTDLETTTTEAPTEEEGRPAEVGAGSRWAAGGAGITSGSCWLLVTLLVALLYQLLHQNPHH